MYITLDNDKWDDLGKRYFVVEWSRRDNSTAVDLILEDEDGNTLHRTEALGHIVVENEE